MGEDRAKARKVLRVGLMGVAAVVLTGAGFVAGTVFPQTLTGSHDPVRAQVRIGEDDFGKLYLGSASVADAYGVDRVVRIAPDTFFDSLPGSCETAFVRLRSVQKNFPSLAEASAEAQAVWGQALLVAQDVCTFDAYSKKFGQELEQWASRQLSPDDGADTGGQDDRSASTPPESDLSVPSTVPAADTTVPVSDVTETVTSPPVSQPDAVSTVP